MKTINVVLAIGTLIIVGALIVLGIKAFYPEPGAPTCDLATPLPAAYPGPCVANDAQCSQKMAAYNARQQAWQNECNAEQTTYNSALQVYNRNLFIVANIVGIIVFIVGFLIVLYGGLAGQGAPVGIMMAGLWGIIYGYMRGWDSIDDRLKFFVGLVVALLVIGGSIWLIQKRHDHLA
jgi:hypothetical protein